MPFQRLAQGHFERLRGQLEAGLRAYESCLELCAPEPSEPWRSIATWPKAVASAIEVEIDLGRYAQARARGEAALELGCERGLGIVLHDISRALALAEAKLNDHASGAARLDAVIEAQRALGVTGLNLGASYEARARLAIWAGDTAAAEQYARLTAREYRHGHGSPLGARYERLMDEAQRAGVPVLPKLSDFVSTIMATTMLGQRLPAAAAVHTMRSADGFAARAARALALICEVHGAQGGHLYLSGEDGLALAASSPSCDAHDAVREFAAMYLAREVAQADMATVFAGDAREQLDDAPASFTDEAGTAFHPLLLTCTVDGITHYAGVAMLHGADRSRRQANTAEIVSAVAGCLFDAGDAHTSRAAS